MKRDGLEPTVAWIDDISIGAFARHAATCYFGGFVEYEQSTPAVFWFGPKTQCSSEVIRNGIERCRAMATATGQPVWLWRVDRVLDEKPDGIRVICAPVAGTSSPRIP